MKRLYLLVLMCISLHVQSQKPFVVVLDAGHGGMDAGAVGSSQGNKEKDINLDVTLGVGKLLNKHCPDVKVIYTRNADYFVKLDERANIANKAKADIFVSIHTNAAAKANSTVTGVESYTLALRTASTNLAVEKRENSVIQFEPDGKQKYMIANNNSAESNIVFEMMQDEDFKKSVELAKLCQSEMVNTGKRADRGVQQANFAVLRLTYMPSVLLELGFISTPEEENFLMTQEGRTILSKCIFNAISKYIQLRTGRMTNLEKISPNEIKQIQEKREEKHGVADGEKKVVDEEKKTTENKQKTTTQEQVLNDETQVVFRVQLFLSKRQHIAGSEVLKGFAPVAVKEGNYYKYMYGETSNYNEVKKSLKKAKDKFPEAFIVAYQNGERIDITKAIQIWQSQKK